jgi:hypothetical protein
MNVKIVGEESMDVLPDVLDSGLKIVFCCVAAGFMSA